VTGAIVGSAIANSCLGLYDRGPSGAAAMMAGSKEDAETVTAFFEDMKRRGLNDPLLVTSDGAAGIICISRNSI
jgi:Transposase, Mutator family